MHKAIRSNVAIAGHPVHPMLIPFPIAFLVGAFVTDLIFWGTTDPFWAQASVYLTLAGLVTGAVAAAVGFTDFVTLPQVRAHRMAWMHFLGNGAVLLLALARSLYSWTSPVEKEITELRSMQRGHEEEALCLVAVGIAHVVKLALGFDALCANPQVHGPCHGREAA